MRLALAVLVALTASARAEPVVLAPGQLEAELVTEINAAPKYAQPLSVAPDVWWGASERWTIGIVHSDPALDVFRPGATFCLRTAPPLSCGHFYRGSGLDVRWRAREGRLAIAPRARLLLRDVDPWKPAVTLGALVRWTSGRLELTGDPYLQLGLANTDRGNRAQLFLPVELSVGVLCRWHVESPGLAGARSNAQRCGVTIDMRTGYNGELATWRDGYHVPLWLGVRALATHGVELGAALGFYSLLGPQATVKERAAFVTVAWRS